VSAPTHAVLACQAGQSSGSSGRAGSSPRSWRTVGGKSLRVVEGHGLVVVPGVARGPRCARCPVVLFVLRRRDLAEQSRVARQGQAPLAEHHVDLPEAGLFEAETSSCEQASTEMVSSCTAPSGRNMALTPPRGRAPRSPTAPRAIRRASSRLKVSAAMAAARYQGERRSIRRWKNRHEVPSGAWHSSVSVSSCLARWGPPLPAPGRRRWRSRLGRRMWPVPVGWGERSEEWYDTGTIGGWRWLQVL
jgi:hypothetical protein